MKSIGLFIVIILLIGLTAYLYLGLMKCKNTATEIGARLQECGTGLQACVTQAGSCQQTLMELEAMCAPYLFQVQELQEPVE